MADGPKKSLLVKPAHPIEGLPLECVNGLPMPFFARQLSFVRAIIGLRQRVVVAVSGAAHRGLDSSLQEPFAVANGDVLRAPVAVLNIRLGQAFGRRAPAPGHRAQSLSSCCGFNRLYEEPTLKVPLYRGCHI
jgi:hypothetical protein